MFLGEFKHTIDDKGRLTIPSKFRGTLSSGLVLTRGFDRNLMVWSAEGWQEFAGRIREKSLTDPKMREFRRRVFSGATDLRPDKQGRVLIPPYLRQFAGIEGTVVVNGMFDYVEIWDETAWRTQRNSIENSDDASYWQDLGF